MKTTLTFAIDTDTDEGNFDQERIDLEKHLRGPSIADTLSGMYRAVYVKVYGIPKGLITPNIVPAEPPSSWQEVLDLLDDHTSDVKDLL